MKCARVLLLALLFSVSPLAWSESALSVAPSYAIYESELVRCLAISARLGQISSELQGKLYLSEESSKILQSELSGLRIELSELRAKHRDSVEHSIALEAALLKAEGLLKSLEGSFATYKRAAENEIAKAYREAKIWKWIGISGGMIGLAGIGWGILR